MLQIKDEDPDIRHMALYDLHTELQKDTFTLDEANQKQVVPAVLERLDDTSTEVQGIAVKWCVIGSASDRKQAAGLTSDYTLHFFAASRLS